MFEPFRTTVGCVMSGGRAMVGAAMMLHAKDQCRNFVAMGMACVHLAMLVD
jgi:hypothetical protein